MHALAAGWCVVHGMVDFCKEHYVLEPALLASVSLLAVQPSLGWKVGMA